MITLTESIPSPPALIMVVIMCRLHVGSKATHPSVDDLAANGARLPSGRPALPGCADVVVQPGVLLHHHQLLLRGLDGDEDAHLAASGGPGEDRGGGQAAKTAGVEGRTPWDSPPALSNLPLCPGGAPPPTPTPKHRSATQCKIPSRSNI